MPLPWIRYLVAEQSMEPTLHSGDHVVASRRAPVERGSIVVYQTAAMTLVKRVVGLPGETVRIDAGVVLIDGSPEPAVWDGATRPDGSWTAGSDEVFVLGDDRQRSTGDSRDTGPVQLAAVVGVVIWRYWPSARRLGGGQAGHRI